MEDQIKAMMRSPAVRNAAQRLGQSLQSETLTPQEQLAAIALLAARQMSTLPTSVENAAEMMEHLVEIGMRS